MKNKFAAPQRHITRIGLSFHFLRTKNATIKRIRAKIFTEEMCSTFPERTAVWNMENPAAVIRETTAGRKLERTLLIAEVSLYLR